MTDLLAALSRALPTLGGMSLTAAYAAAVVAAVRLLLKKRAPKRVLSLLWLVVFARLLIPVPLESPVSIVPDARQVRQLTQQAPIPPEADGGRAVPIQPVLQGPAQGHDPAQGQTQGHDPAQNPAQGYGPALNPAQGHTGGVTAGPVSQGDANSASVPVLTAPAAPRPEAPSPFPWPAVLAGVWLAGALAMAGSALASYLRLRRRLYDAIRAPDGAWEHPSVSSPFILGVFRPKIYLPAGLRGQPRQFILCHERAHLRRLDHIIKPVCWAALAVHWFNPAVWLAFVLMSRDIEAACDEAVLRQLGTAVKADYSATLLSLATGGRLPAPCPLAFDEGDAKGRIQNVLKYQRPTLWIAVASAIMAVAAAVCLLTDPVSAKAPDPAPSPGTEASQPPEPSAAQPLPTPSPGPTQAPAAQPPVLEDWMLEVLSGQREFRRPGGERGYTIHELRSFYYGDVEPPQITVEAGKVTALDLDRDGENELIVFPEGEDQYLYSYVGYLILRQQGEEIAAYDPGWRSVGGLKADGTFNWSSSAFEWGTGRARFDGDEFAVEEIAWCKDGLNHGVADPRFYVDGVRVSQEEFEAATSSHAEKPKPVWYRWYEDTGLQRAVDVLEDQSTYTPKFLGDGLRALYRQASYLYYHLFGENTAGICDMGTPSLWPSGLYDPAEAIERDGLTYLRATGQFARWDDLMAAVDGLFTRGFWNACNQWDGHELFINVDGDTYFLPASRPQGDLFGAGPTPFTPVEQTEGSVTVTLTVGYNEYREGEDETAWSQRVGRGYDYTVDYPIRYVNTADGWRLDEFHYGRTDQRDYILGHILWETDPRAALNGEMDAATLRQVGVQTLLDWGGTTYQIDSGVNAATFTGRMYVLDVDGDGQTEASLVYLDGDGHPIIAVYGRTEHGLERRTAFDTTGLLSSFDDFAQVEQKPEGGLTITHRAPWEITTIELSEKVFDGYEWMKEGPVYAKMEPEFFYVGLASELPMAPPFSVNSFVYLTNGVNRGPYVAHLSFAVDFGGGNYLAPHKLYLEPYDEFAAPAS